MYFESEQSITNINCVVFYPSSWRSDPKM